MAELDFGDRELFQQLDDSAPPLPTHVRFTDDEDEQDEKSQLRSRLEESDDYIQRLTEENKVLRRKLRILTRPSGITVEDVNTDGPLLQILYTNNLISKKCRQEIEDCICSVILKHQKPDREKKSSFHIKPQNSAFALDEEPQKMSSSRVKTTTEAFKVVGSVLYFTTFSVDKLGQPLVNENAQLTEGWDLPTYQQVFNQVIGTDGQEIEMKDKRPKSMCFNCGASSHQLRDCPKPKDMAAINERRKEFNQSNNQGMQSNQRYHVDEVEERFSKYKPGVMSEELLTALGIDENTLPPLIYRMRQLGYPPGWLKEAEMENSGLSLYDGNTSNDGSPTDNTNSQNVSYDVSKLVDFPGFNVPAPHKMKDEFMHFGSIPMQSSHMKQNYAAYLSSFFPVPGTPSNKRRHEFDSSPQLRKKTKSSPDRTSDRSSDMDIESDPGTPYHIHGPGDFQFQPPLPPGSPCFSSPPPLPQGTPPATPTPPPLPKGTPPPTPTNGSPAVRGRDWVVVDETTEETEDDMTLEELEEQQRQIMAALENADTATNSDCETPAMQTPVPSSPSVSTSAHMDTETEDVDEEMDSMRPCEPSISNEIQPEIQGGFSQSPGPVRVEDDSPQSPEPVKAQDSTPQSPELVKAQDSTPQSPELVKAQDSTPQSPEPEKAQDRTPQSPEPEKAQDRTPQSPEPEKAQDRTPQSPEPVIAQDSTPQSPEPVKAQDRTPQSPEPVKAQDRTPQSPKPVIAQDSTPQSPEPVKAQDSTPQSPEPVKAQDRTPQSPEPVKAQDRTPQSPEPVKAQDSTPQSPESMKAEADNPQSPESDFSNTMGEDCTSPVEKITAVPHRSRFAASIVPFEDTPEFTKVAEATGTYLRIRGLLKNSPRSLAKKK